MTMHYFEIKHEQDQKNSDGTIIPGDKLGFKKLFDWMIDVPGDLNTYQFMRLSKVYNKVSQLKDGDFLELEDADYEIVKLKLGYFVSAISKSQGSLLKNLIMQDFVTSIQEMPTDDPRKKVVEPLDAV